MNVYKKTIFIIITSLGISGSTHGESELSKLIEDLAFKAGSAESEAERNMARMLLYPSISRIQDEKLKHEMELRMNNDYARRQVEEYLSKAMKEKREKNGSYALSDVENEAVFKSILKNHPNPAQEEGREKEIKFEAGKLAKNKPLLKYLGLLSTDAEKKEKLRRLEKAMQDNKSSDAFRILRSCAHFMDKTEASDASYVLMEALRTPESCGPSDGAITGMDALSKTILAQTLAQSKGNPEHELVGQLLDKSLEKSARAIWKMKITEGSLDWHKVGGPVGATSLICNDPKLKSRLQCDRPNSHLKLVLQKAAEDFNEEGKKLTRNDADGDDYVVGHFNGLIAGLNDGCRDARKDFLKQSKEMLYDTGLHRGAGAKGDFKKTSDELRASIVKKYKGAILKSYSDFYKLLNNNPNFGSLITTEAVRKRVGVLKEDFFEENCMPTMAGKAGDVKWPLLRPICRPGKEHPSCTLGATEEGYLDGHPKGNFHLKGKVREAFGVGEEKLGTMDEVLKEARAELKGRVYHELSEIADLESRLYQNALDKDEADRILKGYLMTHPMTLAQVMQSNPSKKEAYARKTCEVMGKLAMDEFWRDTKENLTIGTAVAGGLYLGLVSAPLLVDFAFGATLTGAEVGFVAQDKNRQKAIQERTTDAAVTAQNLPKFERVNEKLEERDRVIATRNQDMLLALAGEGIGQGIGVGIRALGRIGDSISEMKKLKGIEVVKNQVLEPAVAKLVTSNSYAPKELTTLIGLARKGDLNAIADLKALEMMDEFAKNFESEEYLKELSKNRHITIGSDEYKRIELEHKKVAQQLRKESNDLLRKRNKGTLDCPCPPGKACGAPVTGNIQERTPAYCS